MTDNTPIAANSIWRNRKTLDFYQVIEPSALNCTNAVASTFQDMVVYREAGHLAASEGDPVFVRERQEFLAKFEHCPTTGTPQPVDFNNGATTDAPPHVASVALHMGTFGSFQVMKCASTVDGVLTALKALGSPIPLDHLSWKLDCFDNLNRGPTGLGVFPYVLYFGPPGRRIMIGYCSHSVSGHLTKETRERFHEK